MLKASVTVIIVIGCTSCGTIFRDEDNILNDSKVTTLYPINATLADLKTKITESDTNITNVIESNFTASDDLENASEEVKVSALPNTRDIETENIENDAEEENPKIAVANSSKPINNMTKVEFKNDQTTWKIDTSYSQKTLDDGINESNDEKQQRNEEMKSMVKEFKPSPHLGSFSDEDTYQRVAPTLAAVAPFTPVIKKPTGSLSSSQDFYKLNYKKPIDSPYKYESNSFTKAKFWKHSGLESKPTMEVPVRIPAGGLYHGPVVFRDPPTVSDGHFGLPFKEDVKEVTVKTRQNPWKGLLNLVTALLPIGIIISALTPSLVTLETTGNDPHYTSKITRYTESNISELPRISERCKRRLLCEIHSDHNYIGHENLPSPGYKYCYKIQCEDPQAMHKMLQWLLTQHHPHLGSYRPNTDSHH